MRYVDPAWGLTGEARGRMLIASEASYEEWGVDAMVQFDPGMKERGLIVDLRSRYGEPASGMEQLWEHEPTGSTPVSRWWNPGGELSGRVGYGVELSGGAVMTPYGGAALSDGADPQYRLGVDLRLGGLAMGVEGELRESAGEAAARSGDYRIRIQGRLRY